MHAAVCIGGEGLSSSSCEAVPREAFTVEGHEAGAAEAHH